MNKKLISTLIAALIILLLVVIEIFLLINFSHDTWYNTLGFVLMIIGFYGISIGFIQKSENLNSFFGTDDMTSPHPVKFIIGNFYFLSILFFLASIALGHKRSPGSSFALGCLGQFLVLCTLPLIISYCFLHLLLICPFAYIGYMFTSAIVESITGSSDDIEMIKTSGNDQLQKIRFKEIIAANPSATKSFLIAIPALLLSFIIKGFVIFFK